ncbi:MAG: GAF domain-containing sensor histidine kinase [Melioribacteraceae bacterium]|nr:GAF domain-containing sensor histidine kinase [Melioribacteraceae bacterium]
MKFANFRDNLDPQGQSNFGSDYYKNPNLRPILEISRKINSSLILEEVFELVIKNAIEITKSERGFILLREDGDDDLQFKIGLNSKGEKISRDESNISMSVSNDVYETKESAFIECAQSDSLHDPSKSIFSLELQTILCSPLKFGEEILGILYVDSKQIQKIRVKEITDTFEILAEQASSAIKNAKLYRDLLESNKVLESTNTELLLAKKAAEKSDKLKSEFLAQMSHEIRTPINSILSFSNLLRDEFEDKVDDDLATCFNIITRSGERIIRTTDLILNMSEMQIGSYESNFSDIDVFSEILQPVYIEHKKSAKLKNLEFKLRSLTTNTIRKLDSYTVKHIFSNLINNAIKFTNEGRVTVLILDDDKDKLVVKVKDTGIGISDKYLPNLFEPFSQEEQGYTRKFDGNGLGLALVKEYCRLNNAIIIVESTKGQGSTFTVTFCN